MKPRRDITLGEMQDECRRRNAFCGDMGACPYRDFCHETVGDKYGWGDKGPRDWNLTDPPRFNEDQMSFWRGWHAMGADLVTRFGDGHMVFSTICGDYLATIERYFDLVDIMEKGETLDIAELLGKDAT